MIVLAIASLLTGWLLGQFFKVLVLIPASGLAIPVIFAVSVFLGDTLLQTALKIAACVWIMAVGYALGQMVFNLPSILRGWRKAPAEETAWTPRKAPLTAKKEGDCQ